MIIAVTGIRELDEASVLDVELATLDAASASTQMRFGGADGSDTIALECNRAREGARDKGDEVNRGRNS
jgi:hypothetical protein